MNHLTENERAVWVLLVRANFARFQSEIEPPSAEQLTDAVFKLWMVTGAASAVPGALVERSRNDRLSWVALASVCEQILLIGTFPFPLPLELSQWIADRITGRERAQRPPRVQGRPRKYTARDKTIVFVVEFLKDNGIDPRKKTPAAHENSACDIVADALGMTYSAVEKVWRERPRVVRLSAWGPK